MLGSLGGPELAIIAVVIILIFGVGKFSSLGKDLGTSIKEFRRAVKDEDPEAAKNAQQAAITPAASRAGAQQTCDRAAARATAGREDQHLLAVPQALSSTPPHAGAFPCPSHAPNEVPSPANTAIPAPLAPIPGSHLLRPSAWTPRSGTAVTAAIAAGISGYSRDRIVFSPPASNSSSSS